MNWTDILGLTVALLVMFVGIVGSIIPIIPSTTLVFIAALGHKLCFGVDGVKVWVLLVLGLITAFSFLIDHIATMIGAKKFGATWKGVAGAVIGGIVGLFFGLVGILIGPFIGAVAFELAGRRTLWESGQAGIGTLVGLLAGALGKLACCAVMTGLFLFDLLLRAFAG